MRKKLKRTAAFFLLFLLGNSCLVSANEEETGDIYSLYTTQLTIKTAADAEPLTLDEAIRKTVTNSTALKKSNSNLEESRKTMNTASNTYYYSLEDGFSSLLSLIKSQSSYDDAILSRERQEKDLYFSMKQAYISILNAEREMALMEQELKNKEQQLVITRTKAARKLISEQELAEQELSFQKAKTALSQQETALTEAHASFCVLMGEQEDKRYALELSVFYTPMTPPADLEQYIQSAVANNEEIQQKKNALKLAEDQLKLYTAGNGNYDSLVNSVNNADLTLADAKRELENKIRSCYNSIVKTEEDITSNQAELERLKQVLLTEQVKFDRQLTTELALSEAKYQIANMENTLIAQIYEHSQLMDKFNDVGLL